MTRRDDPCRKGVGYGCLNIVQHVDQLEDAIGEMFECALIRRYYWLNESRDDIRREPRFYS